MEPENEDQEEADHDDMTTLDDCCGNAALESIGEWYCCDSIRTSIRFLLGAAIVAERLLLYHNDDKKVWIMFRDGEIKRIIPLTQVQSNDSGKESVNEPEDISSNMEEMEKDHLLIDTKEFPPLGTTYKVCRYSPASPTRPHPLFACCGPLRKSVPSTND